MKIWKKGGGVVEKRGEGVNEIHAPCAYGTSQEEEEVVR